MGYELVSEEEAQAHMSIGRWICKALQALRGAGVGRIAKVKLRPDSKARYSNLAGEYARRLGMVITCRTREGHLWIEYLGELPHWEVDDSPEKLAAQRTIMRRLGK